MRNLVFTSKWVGARCITYLLDSFPEDDYTFVLCEPEADMIAKMLDRRGLPYMRLGEDALRTIRDSKEAYYDWLLNLWGGHIFRKDTLSRARHSLNIHPAYLPYCRGRDPIVWAIRRGFPAGVTLHAITEQVDEGPIWYREKVPYELPIRGSELYDRVVERCCNVFCDKWATLREGHVMATPQSALKDVRTFRRSDLLVDRDIDLDTDAAARDVILRLLAHDFSPGYTARLVIGGKFYSADLSLLPCEEASTRGIARQDCSEGQEG